MRYACLLACLLLSSCVSSTTYFPQHSQNPSEATVYIIRQHAHPGTCAIDVFVDSRLAATVADHSFSKFSVPAGQRRFTFRWPPICTKEPVSANIDIKGGQTRYFVVSGTSRISGFYVVVLTVKQTTQVAEVTAAKGQRLIEELKR
jgi:hypothetical protein